MADPTYFSQGKTVFVQRGGGTVPMPLFEINKIWKDPDNLAASIAGKLNTPNELQSPDVPKQTGDENE